MERLRVSVGRYFCAPPHPPPPPPPLFLPFTPESPGRYPPPTQFYLFVCPSAFVYTFKLFNFSLSHVLEHLQLKMEWGFKLVKTKDIDSLHRSFQMFIEEATTCMCICNIYVIFPNSIR